jgi:cation:H+ antiporter
MAAAIAFTVLGLVLLPIAADRFVDAATRLSRALKVSPILIGALLVGFGTSLPEIAVSSIAAAQGDAGFAVGNIVGSNVANLALVLGLAGVIRTVVLGRELLRREGVLVLLATVGYALLLVDGEVGRWEALMLVAGLVVAIYLLTMWSDVGRQLDFEDGATPEIRRQSIVAVVGMAATVGGAAILVEGAERLAVELEITSAFVAVTLVALGTSLPELATAVAATRRGEGDLVIGNVMGSNLFNVLAVGGISGLIGPGTIESGFSLLLLLMVAVTLLAGLLLYQRSRLSGLEGAVLLVTFFAFVVVAGPALA